MTNKKILPSGVKPTGRPHLGNYFGAMKQFIDLQDEYDCRFMIADYHALNFIQNREEMKENIFELFLDYLAIGLDPEKSIIFKQSDVSAHTELAWIFETLTTMPYLMRAHAFKDAEAKNKDIVVGTFNYPMLMASDILLYDADVVPVGSDQKQHVEITRDTAEKFNRVFATETFKLPEPLILENVATVPGTDGQKMSKSYGNTIGLFATDEEIKKAVMGIVTDSSGERPENVYAIHSLLKDSKELDVIYEEKKGKYKELKEALAEDIISFVTPMRERREALKQDRGKVLKLIKEGGERAREIADKKMIEVKDKIGLNIE